MLAWRTPKHGKRPSKRAKPIITAVAASACGIKAARRGHVQKVKSIRLDGDGDAVVLLIEQIGGAACHEGYRSCFSRELRDGKVSCCSELVFDPKEVYNG